MIGLGSDKNRQRGQHCNALLDKTKQRDHDKSQSQEKEEEPDKEEEDGHHCNDCVMIIIQPELWHKALETFDKRCGNKGPDEKEKSCLTFHFRLS